MKIGKFKTKCRENMEGAVVGGTLPRSAEVPLSKAHPGPWMRCPPRLGPRDPGRDEVVQKTKGKGSEFKSRNKISVKIKFKPKKYPANQGARRWSCDPTVQSGPLSPAQQNCVIVQIFQNPEEFCSIFLL